MFQPMLYAVITNPALKGMNIHSAIYFFDAITSCFTGVGADPSADGRERGGLTCLVPGQLKRLFTGAPF